MMKRCRDKKNPNYGGAGIAVCDRWAKGEGSMSGVECFVSDMGKRPSAAHSLDRLNVNGDYEPKNCRWATDKQQIRNRTNTRFVVYNGMRMALGDACDLAGLKYGMVLQRLQKGMTIEEALAPRPKQSIEEKRERQKVYMRAYRAKRALARHYGLTTERKAA